MTIRRIVALVATLTIAACGASSAPDTTNTTGTGADAESTLTPEATPAAEATPTDRSYDADADEAKLYARITNPPKMKPKKPRRVDKKGGTRDDDDDLRLEVKDEPTEAITEEEGPVSIETLDVGAHTLRHSVDDMEVVEAVFVTDAVIVTAAVVIEQHDEDALTTTLGALVAPLAECYGRFHAAHGAMSMFAMIGTRKDATGGVGFYLIESDKIGRESPMFSELAKEIDACSVTNSNGELPMLLVSQLRAR
jgi:hypothetical protein